VKILFKEQRKNTHAKENMQVEIRTQNKVELAKMQDMELEKKK